jgi:transglycosylase-like protein with SLT domain/D-alanyl-D-alanine carboxypeptidase-like protein/putative Flp pilus-assembly TadE/G-like protein
MSSRGERGQTLVLMIAAGFVLLLSVGVLGALGQALLGRGRTQRAADLGAVSAARSMRDDFWRLFEPATLGVGRLNPRHLTKDRYLDRARAAGLDAVRLNGANAAAVRVEFPDRASFAPTRVRVVVLASATVRSTPAADTASVPVRASAEAEMTASGVKGLPNAAEGGGYSGPLAYRQGKPMRPDVARAFDRMEAAARGDGVHLIITSAYRPDAEQAELYKRHPDPKWVAPPGRSLHRLGTELDLGPPSAYGWLTRNAERFHFTKRYSWEPWHYGYGLNPRSAPPVPERGSAVPSFVPGPYVETIARAASRWNVSAALLAAQLYAESNFNPFAVSGAGARGIAQFMPGTARSYGLADPFDATASIAAQAHLMRDLLRRFASVSLALAAYNAGAGAVERCGCVPPYPETQAYVARILGLMGGAGELLPGAPGMEVRLVE